MHDILFIADGAAPLAEGEAPVGASGLARALAAAGHAVTLVTLGTQDAPSAIAGLARRLSPVRAAVGGQAVELTLYEGRIPLSSVRLLVLAAGDVPRGRGRVGGLLATAIESLTADGLVTPNLAIGWGETAAAALSATAAERRLFVLPSGRLGSLLTAEEASDLGTVPWGDDSAGRSLVALGAAAANAIVAPSPSAARLLESDPGLATRASDEPFLALRFGCDDWPHDPASDPALPATYTAASLAGKAECRRALARRASLALGPRTLLLCTPPLRAERGGESVLALLPRLAPLDVVVAINGGGDRELVERARVLAIEHPGRIALVGDDDPVTRRQIRAGADAQVLADADDRTGRAASLAILYGTLPIAPDAGACRDHLVDYDPASGTGTALLYEAGDTFALESAVRRAVSLRHDADAFTALPRSLMPAAPSWAATAARIIALADG